MYAGPAAGQPVEAAAGEFDRPGLELVLRSSDGGASDARVARLAALQVPAGKPASPFLPVGPFEAVFRGAIELDLNDWYRFSVRGSGAVRLSIGGQVVIERETLSADGAPVSTDGEIRLNKGLNPIEIVYRGPANGDAWVRLSWSNEVLPEEPIPPTSLRHAGSTALDRGQARRAGRNLVADAMCVRCHPAAATPDEPGHAMPELATTGPDLDGIGSRLHREWIEQWLLDPPSLRRHARMPRLLSTDPGQAQRQAADLTAYLVTAPSPDDADEADAPSREAGDQAADLVADRPSGASAGDADESSAQSRDSDNPTAAPTATPTANELADGQRLYDEIGCAACHGDATSPPPVAAAYRLVAPDPDADADPDRQALRLGDKWRPSALVRYLRDPTEFDPSSSMPKVELEAAEAAALAAYLLTPAHEGGAAPKPASSVQTRGSEPTNQLAANAVPRDPRARQGDSERGRRLADELGCRGCHALSGGEPAPAASPLRALAGRAGVWTSAADEATTHPRYDFTPREVEAIEQFLAEDAASLSRTVPTEYAERSIARSGCLACHARDGVPASWSPATAPSAAGAANDPADIFALPAGSDDETGPDFSPPDLTWVGEKLRSDWLASYLAGRLHDRPRPHLRVRMPAFAAREEILAAGLHHQHGLPASPPPDPSTDAELAAIGRDLIRGDRLGCHACHALGDEPALGGEGSAETINFDLVRRRLRRPWFDWFLRDPQRLLPGTKMPQFVDEDGYTALYDVLNGEATRQFEAIWQYLGTIE